jgi:hypothetical protein
MSEENQVTPTEGTQATEAAAPAKKKTEYTDVTMKDGRVVKFAGTRLVQKTVTVNEAAGWVSVLFDFRNGETRTASSIDFTHAIQLQAMGHGLSQKIGDEWNTEKNVDDIVLVYDDIYGRLMDGNWFTAREAGDSMSGASLVIQALVEVTGKSVEFIKGFLQKKLDTAKAAGQKLTRQDLYASFRVPGTATATVIKRLEDERAAKGSKGPAASDLLAEMDALPG